MKAPGSAVVIDSESQDKEPVRGTFNDITSRHCQSFLQRALSHGQPVFPTALYYNNIYIYIYILLYIYISSTSFNCAKPVRNNSLSFSSFPSVFCGRCNLFTVKEHAEWVVQGFKLSGSHLLPCWLGEAFLRPFPAVPSYRRSQCTPVS
jgi:hypothetical protein